MGRFILTLHEIIVVLQQNKMKITHRELREKLSDMAKNVPKSHQKTLELTDSQKIVREEDRKHMYIVGARKFSKVTKCFSNFMTRCHLNKQS